MHIIYLKLHRTFLFTACHIHRYILPCGYVCMCACACTCVCVVCVVMLVTAHEIDSTTQQRIPILLCEIHHLRASPPTLGFGKGGHERPAALLGWWREEGREQHSGSWRMRR